MNRTRKEEREYWLFSKDDRATFARARNDVPLDEIFDATEDEVEAICAQIRTELERGEFYEIWINVLVYFNDTSALDILQKREQEYREKHRVAVRDGGGFTSWIRMLQDAIKQLKRAKQA